MHNDHTVERGYGFSEEDCLGLTVKPVTIRNSTYLLVPKDVAELLRVMATKTCSVNFQIDEKGCSLI